MDALYKRWKRIPQAIRKTLVLIAGSTVILTGLVMLVLPGPGWLAIFVGLAILASEFVIAERARDWAVDRVNKYAAKAEQKIKKSLKRE